MAIYRFAPLYDKYYKEVYPAKLVFVSFLRRQTDEGDMMRPLKQLGYSPLQFKFDQQRPDLTKLDSLFGRLSSESQTFEEEVRALEEAMDKTSIQDVLKSAVKESKDPTAALASTT